MIKTIFIVICLMTLLFSCLYGIKNEITYKNLKIISDVVYRYNISMIKDERYDELISYDDIKSCEKHFLIYSIGVIKIFYQKIRICLSNHLLRNVNIYVVS